MVGRILGYIDPNVQSRCDAVYFEHDYSGQPVEDQEGGFLPVYTRVFREQHGGGWASKALAGAQRFIMPFLSGFKRAGKRVIQEVGKQALATAGNYVGDLASGVNWRQAGYNRMNEAGDSFDDRMQLLYGDGTPRNGELVQQNGSGRVGKNKYQSFSGKLFSAKHSTVVRGRKKKSAVKSGRVGKNKKKKKPTRKSPRKTKPTQQGKGLLF
jgi:hypothetical protein